MKRAAYFVYVWPEPRSSAAGVRTLSLARDLISLGYEVTFISPCRENAASVEIAAAGFGLRHCPANDSGSAENLRSLAPELVVYDRFVMEEQFGWRAQDLWPEALHLVDTQDLHCLRRARERELNGTEAAPDTEREISALYRADACFVVSAWERQWLVEQGYPEDRVCHLPFGAEAESNLPGFSARRGFTFLGNFRHGPNRDAVKLLAEEIWPQLRTRLPQEKLFLYGAYPPAYVSQLHGKNQIVVEGPVENHRAALKKHRVLLAPLRFGAGIKGKVLEAWACGTAVCGSPIAMEGLDPGAATDAEDFVGRAFALHEEEELWEKCQASGLDALAHFSPANLRQELADFLARAVPARPGWRAQLTGRMLRHHLHYSTKYLSRWIEEKNKK